MFDLLKFVGTAEKRVLTAQDLKNLGATEENLKSLSGNSVLTFLKGVASEVESGLAGFIANHPSLSGEFHKLSDDEVNDETEVHNPKSEGADAGDTGETTTPAGTVPAEGSVPSSSATPAGGESSPSPTSSAGTGSPEASSSPAQTSTTESAAANEPSPATSTIATPPAN